MKKTLAFILFFFSATAFAQTAATEYGSRLDKEALEKACAPDAEKTGCSDYTVGNGLLRCFRVYVYYGDHENFKFTKNCQTQLKRFYLDATFEANHVPKLKTKNPESSVKTK